jgi:hypothetical protein
MKNRCWLAFVALGILIVVAAVPVLSMPLRAAGDQFSWLTRDGEVLEFVGWVFLVQGIWQVGLGLMVIITAVTGYRAGQRWAWMAMWVAPALLIAVSAAMPWVLPFTALMILAAVAVQLNARPFFAAADPPPAIG